MKKTMKKTMKVMAILLCAVTMVMMSACSKEDTYQRRIVGKWEVVHHAYGIFDPLNISPSQFDSDDVGDIWEFRDNGLVWIDDDPPVSYAITEDYLVIAGLVSFNIQELTKNSLIIWIDYGSREYYELQKDR